MIRIATDLTVNYPQMIRWDVQSHLILARIRVSLPLEVLVAMATPHEFARDSAYKADNDF